MRHHRLLACLPLIAGLGACGTSGPEQVSQTRPSVSYRIESGQRAEADARANAYCSNYGLNAKLTASGPDSSGSTIATYACQ